MNVSSFRILFSAYIILGFMLMTITLMQSLGKASKASVAGPPTDLHRPF